MSEAAGLEVRSRVSSRSGGIAATILIALGVLALAAFFLVMSSRTGAGRHEQAQQLLDNVATAGTALDSTLFPLLFELRTDLDAVTAAQRMLMDDIQTYEAFVGDAQAAMLAATVATKLSLVDDFKARQAVSRNSRSIASEMIAGLVDRDGAAATLDAVERQWLRFESLGGRPGSSGLDAAIEAAEAAEPTLAVVPEWQSFRLHAASQQRNEHELRTLLLSVYDVPLTASLEGQAEELRGAYLGTQARADAYRLAMFGLAVVLLLFSGYKAVQAGRYVRLVRRANDELEERVQARTAELESATDALQTEMRERVEVEAQLRMAQKLESIGLLAAGIAHEINTPTQYVSDNVNFLETAWSDLGNVIDEYERAVLCGDADSARGTAVWDEADVEYLRGEIPSALREAASGLRQIAKIVKAMKAFSHPGDESLQPADLNQAIENTVEVARNEWKYVAELELDLETGLPLVPCDLSAINQLILNIVVNAAQAIGGRLEAGELGHIWITSRRRGECVEVVIDDDGPGIPEAIRSQVFDPFFTTKEVGKGTGQGLAIAYRVVQQHGGTLTLGEGRDGRGARFTITLPFGGGAEDDTPVPAFAAGTS